MLQFHPNSLRAYTILGHLTTTTTTTTATAATVATTTRATTVATTTGTHVNNWEIVLELTAINGLLKLSILPKYGR